MVQTVFDVLVDLGSLMREKGGMCSLQTPCHLMSCTGMQSIDESLPKKSGGNVASFHNIPCNLQNFWTQSFSHCLVHRTTEGNFSKNHKC
jgi:hypothetical protein